MADVNPRGRFVWQELMTTAPDAAITFYTKVIGWGTMPYQGAMPYTMWTAAETPIGGVMQLPPEAAGAPPHWLSYVAVPDVDGTAQQTQSLGGKVMVPPTDIPTVGRFAVVADPQGAMIAVFKSAGNTPGHEGAPKLGEFSWHELMTTDYAAAFNFYNTLFGWDKIEEHDMGPMGVYLIYGRNGVPLGGMFNKPAEMPMPPNWLPYIAVDSADRVAALVNPNGGKILNGPMDVPGGDRIAQCSDPQGAAFAIHSRKSS